MSYTEQIENVNGRMESFERELQQIKRDQKKGFQELRNSIDKLNTGIHGTEEHDQVGYRQRIARVEENQRELLDFKKKIMFIASLIGAGAGTVITILINIFQTLTA